MANEYQPGDLVTVYTNAFNQAADQGGQHAMIVRQMPEESEGLFYEVAYTGEVPEGTAIIVTAECLRKNAIQVAAVQAPEPAAGE